MKIVTVDVVGADDDVAAAAVQQGIALAKDADRLLLFGHAAVIGARLYEQDREDREGAWLEQAAAWLLSDDPPNSEKGLRGPPPRPAAGPLTRAFAVMSARADAVMLARSDRVVEMAGSLLVMAVPAGDHVDAVDNANLWLVGGAVFSVAQHGTRAVVTLGDRVVVTTVFGGEASIVAHGFDGTKAEHAFGLQVSNRMSVRAS